MIDVFDIISKISAKKIEEGHSPEYALSYKSVEEGDKQIDSGQKDQTSSDVEFL